MRNPYAKSLRAKPQQIIPDKREKTLRQILDQTTKEEVPEDLRRLLDDIR